MPNTGPATAPLTINDLINKVKANLQNRSDVSEAATNPEMRPSAWIRDALREITSTPDLPFEELRVNGPLVTIGPGLGYKGSNYAYPVSMFLNSGDDMVFSEDPVIFFNGQQATSAGLAITTSNVVGYSMDYLTPKAIQPLLFIPGGVPFKYTRYGAQFWFGTQPGQPYNVYLPYQIRHPFNNDLVTTQIRLPLDWMDILAYAAAERGAVNLRWNDQATYLHNLLYGDPKSMIPGTGQMGRPGLIAAKITQMERDRRISTIQIMPGANRY